MQTIRAVNEALYDPEKAVADETLAAVLLLTHVVVSLLLHANVRSKKIGMIEVYAELI